MLKEISNDHKQLIVPHSIWQNLSTDGCTCSIVHPYQNVVSLTGWLYTHSRCRISGPSCHRQDARQARRCKIRRSTWGWIYPIASVGCCFACMLTMCPCRIGLCVPARCWAFYTRIHGQLLVWPHSHLAVVLQLLYHERREKSCSLQLSRVVCNLWVRSFAKGTHSRVITTYPKGTFVVNIMWPT